MEADDQRWQNWLAVELLTKQLQEANAALSCSHAAVVQLTLERNALKDELAAERAKTAAIIRAAAQTPQIPEPVTEESFPSRALRYSWGSK